MGIPFGRSLLSLALIAGLSSEAFALRIAMPSVTPQQAAARADVIVVGKITEIEKEPTEALNAPKGTPMNYRIAVLKIEEAVAGAKNLTQVRVGFSETPKIATEATPAAPPLLDAPAPVQANKPVLRRDAMIRRPLVQAVVLFKDQEGLFFLRKHHSGDFYVPMPFAQHPAKTQDDFKKQVDLVKKIQAIVTDPKTALQAKDKKDRELAACTLVNLYTSPGVGFGMDPVSPKQQVVSAEESKLILDTLAGMDWGTFDPETQTGLQAVWYGMNMAQYGWKQPMFQGGVQQNDVNAKMTESVREFLKDNAGKIRLKKTVLAE